MMYILYAENNLHRERYPLTSQLIEENRIPEFGGFLIKLAQDTFLISDIAQIIYTWTLMALFITVGYMFIIFGL